MTVIVKPYILRESNSVEVLAFSKSKQYQYLVFRKSTIGLAFLGSILSTILAFFLAKIHDAIPFANLGSIYGAMLFMTIFGGYS